MRTLLASLLTVVAVVLVPFADLAVWVQRELVGTTPFVRLGEQVLDQGAVRDALAQRIVIDVGDAAPAFAGQASALQPAVAALLTQPSIRPALDDLLASTHDQLRSGHDPLQLDLSPVLPVLRQQLPPFLATRLPSALTLAPVTVLRRRDAPAVWDGVQLVQGAALALPIVALLALVGALLAARRRAGVCVAVGLATTLASVGLIALLKPGRSLLEHQTGTPTQRAAFLAGYDTVTRSFVQQTVVLAVIGGALVAFGLLVLWRESRNTRPSGWA